MHRTQKGFTLIEIAVVIAILGVVTASGIAVFNNYIRSDKADKTEIRADRVLDSLSVYAQRYNRLPCPADPAASVAQAGQEKNNGRCFITQNGATTGYSISNASTGILPWRALGLSEEDARDSWGRYFTYKPAPHLTMDTRGAPTFVSTSGGNAVVHDACRTPQWFARTGSVTSGHANRPKALFCCNATPPTTFLSVIAGVPGVMPTNYRDNAIVTDVSLSGAGSEATVDSAATVSASNAWIDKDASYYSDFSATNRQGSNSTQPDSPQIRAAGIAVTLISHGVDGGYAYSGANESTRNDGRANALETAAVQEPQAIAGIAYNPKTSQGLLDRLGNRPSAADDIVISLRTDQVYSRVGNATCAKPTGLIDRTNPNTDNQCELTPELCKCPYDVSSCIAICDDDPVTPTPACTGTCEKAFPTVGVTSCAAFYSGYTTATVSGVSTGATGVTVSCPSVGSVFIEWQRFSRNSVPPSELALYDAAGVPQQCYPSCGATTVNWGGSAGTTCSAPIAAGGEGDQTTVNDTIGNGYGNADYRCVQGAWVLQPGSQCGCPPVSPVTWSSGTANCSGNGGSGRSTLPPFFSTTPPNPASGATPGADWTIEDNTNDPHIGNADYSCDLETGTWIPLCENCN
ncbi:MAG: type II secretion system protein [Pseudomonadota bacterium]